MGNRYWPQCVFFSFLFILCPWRMATDDPHSTERSIYRTSTSNQCLDAPEYASFSGKKKKQCYAASQWLFSLFLKICQIRKLIRGWGITNQCTAAFLSPRCCWVGCGDGVCRGSLVALGGTQEEGMGDRQP